MNLRYRTLLSLNEKFKLLQVSKLAQCGIRVNLRLKNINISMLKSP